MTAMMIRLAAVSLFVSRILAQTIEPSNDAIPNGVDSLILTYSAGGMQAQVNLAPLTRQIGLDATQTALNSISIIGPIWPIDAHNASNLQLGDLAYISCDSNTNSSNISPSDVFGQAVLQPIKAAILYSLTDSHCNITGSYTYSTILTMTSVRDASMLLAVINNNPGNPPSASIKDGTMTTGSGAGNQTTNMTPAPTTAVAMSILYTITGVITLLFIAIIATGAIRAHRHPERYGPRAGIVPGRPRQSRAKGLARAMLETLPIVKFGDDEPPKPVAENIELENGANRAASDGAATASTEGDKDKENAKPKDVEAGAEAAKTEEVTATGLGPDTQSAVKTGGHEDLHDSDNNLGCSICTEDFEKGEDVRVLPCNHKFHPLCIDPWLLNVSGTCPLCRVDLRGNVAETTDAPDGGDIAPTPSLAAATTSERIAILRNLREQLSPIPGRPAYTTTTDTTDPTSTSTDPASPSDATTAASRGSRSTGRFRDRFRLGSHPVPEVRESMRAAVEERRRASIAAARALQGLNAGSSGNSYFSSGGAMGLSALPVPANYRRGSTTSATGASGRSGSVSAATPGSEGADERTASAGSAGAAAAHAPIQEETTPDSGSAHESAPAAAHDAPSTST